jgi:hypothetical protein
LVFFWFSGIYFLAQASGPKSKFLKVMRSPP